VINLFSKDNRNSFLKRVKEKKGKYKGRIIEE